MMRIFILSLLILGLYSPAGAFRIFNALSDVKQGAMQIANHLGQQVKKAIHENKPLPQIQPVMHELHNIVKDEIHAIKAAVKPAEHKVHEIIHEEHVKFPHQKLPSLNFDLTNIRFPSSPIPGVKPASVRKVITECCKTDCTKAVLCRLIDDKSVCDKAYTFLEKHSKMLCRGIPKEVIDEPIVEEPVDEEPVKDEPVKDEPIKDEPKGDEPIKDEPIKDEPVKDEPVKDEPVKDEPVKDEPVKDEPVKDEPNDPKEGQTRGDPHMSTFDGLRYDYQGVGTYVLFTDGCNGIKPTFRVESITVGGVNKKEQPIARVAAATIELLGNNPHTIHLYQGGNTMVDNHPLEPFDEYKAFEFEHDGIKTELTLPGKFTVKWDGAKVIMVELYPKMHGNVCGLLGNADGNPENDLTMPNGKLAETVNEFGRSWVAQQLWM